jgi:diguanylate cyclase (GGDEF)-like protein
VVAAFPPSPPGLDDPPAADERPAPDSAASAGWPLVAAPDAELAAALSGTPSPETFARALHELEEMAGRYDAWIADLVVDLTTRLNGEQQLGGPPEAPSDAPLRVGACRIVLAGEPLLESVCARVGGLGETAGLFADCAGRDRRLATADVAAFVRDATALGRDLRRLLSDVWSRLADIDPLTGLANRSAMLRRLAIESERHQRAGQPCSVAVLDLDRFKAVNDTYGHLAGDTVLRSVAALLAGNVRPYDAVFRFAGDEFLICFPNADLRTAWAVAQRLRLRIAGWSIPVGEHHAITATISIGIAPLYPDGTVEHAVERADAALYAAKRQGRDCVVVFAS